MAKGDIKDVEQYLSPSEAGRVLGTSGQWVKQLVCRGELDGVETSLGWLIEPDSVERLANKRLDKTERKLSSMKSARAQTKSKSTKSAVHGRAAHGKSLRGKKSR